MRLPLCRPPLCRHRWPLLPTAVAAAAVEAGLQCCAPALQTDADSAQSFSTAGGIRLPLCGPPLCRHRRPLLPTAVAAAAEAGLQCCGLRTSPACKLTPTAHKALKHSRRHAAATVRTADVPPPPASAAPCKLPPCPRQPVPPTALPPLAPCPHAARSADRCARASLLTLAIASIQLPV